jgi:hypothetical protein
MKSCINPLRLVSAPPPPPLPAPPPLSQASVLIPSLVNLTRGTQGCPKIISFDKSNWHPNFWRVFFNLLFLCCFATRTFSQHLPVNLVWRVPGFMKEGKADNEHSNPCLITLAPKFSTSAFLIYSCFTFKNFC